MDALDTVQLTISRQTGMSKHTKKDSSIALSAVSLSIPPLESAPAAPLLYGINHGSNNDSNTFISTPRSKKVFLFFFFFFFEIGG